MDQSNRHGRREPRWCQSQLPIDHSRNGDSPKEILCWYYWTFDCSPAIEKKYFHSERWTLFEKNYWMFLVKIFGRQIINPISQGDIVLGQAISLNIFRPAKLDIQDVETRTEAEHQGFVLQHCTLRNNSFCRWYLSLGQWLAWKLKDRYWEGYPRILLLQPKK